MDEFIQPTLGLGVWCFLTRVAPGTIVVQPHPGFWEDFIAVDVIGISMLN